MEGIDRLHGIAEDVGRTVWLRELGAALSDTADAIEGGLRDLSGYESDVLAWVEENGGLDAVKELLDWVVGHCSTRQQLDFDFWLSGRVMHELGFEEDMADRDEVERRLLARLVPEGYEWPTVDGKPVDFVTGYEPSLGVLEAVSIYSNGACEVMGHDGIIKDVTEIHIAAPKVLDADGNRIEPAMDVWWICEGDERGLHAERLRVEAIGLNGLVECSPYNGGTWVYLEPYELYVNKPVLAADGKPLEVGQTVYLKTIGKEYIVEEVSQKYVLAKEPDAIESVDFNEFSNHLLLPSQLTHTKPEPPDSWERIEEDAELDICVYFNNRRDVGCADCPANCQAGCETKKSRDLVRRAKALAGDA